MANRLAWYELLTTDTAAAWARRTSVFRAIPRQRDTPCSVA